MHKYKIVLFDLDGTLIDNTTAIVDIYKRAAISLGKQPPDDDFIASLGGKSTYATAEAMGIERQYRSQVDAFFWREFRMYCKELREKPNLISGVKSLLTQLSKRGIRMGVVTSNERENAEFLLQKAELLNHFELIIGRNEVTNYKPSPIPLITALKSMGIETWSKDEIIYVGDTESDVRSAKVAGVLAVQLTSGKSEADHCIQEISQVLELFDK